MCPRMEVVFPTSCSAGCDGLRTHYLHAATPHQDNAGPRAHVQLQVPRMARSWVFLGAVYRATWSMQPVASSLLQCAELCRCQLLH